MPADRRDFLQRAASDLEELQADARERQLLSVAYMIELAREEILDQLHRICRPELTPEHLTSESNVLLFSNGSRAKS